MTSGPGTTAKAGPRHGAPRTGIPTPRVPGERTRRVTAGPRTLRIVAVVPAYNEGDAIAATIASLRQQTRTPDRIVVVPNNCTDDTAEVADRAGAEVMTCPGDNPDKKAGAINYALNRIEPYLDDPWNWAVLVMDADTTLSPEFLEVAERNLTSGVGGVGPCSTSGSSAAPAVCCPPDGASTTPIPSPRTTN